MIPSPSWKPSSYESSMPSSVTPSQCLAFFDLPIWPQCYHAEPMWCEAVETEEKDQLTAPEIGASTKMPLQFLLPHGDEAADSVEQITQNRYNARGCHARCLAFHPPPVPYPLYQPWDRCLALHHQRCHCDPEVVLWLSCCQFGLIHGQ